MIWKSCSKPVTVMNRVQGPGKSPTPGNQHRPWAQPWIGCNGDMMRTYIPCSQEVCNPIRETRVVFEASTNSGLSQGRSVGAGIGGWLPGERSTGIGQDLASPEKEAAHVRVGKYLRYYLSQLLSSHQY